MRWFVAADLDVGGGDRRVRSVRGRLDVDGMEVRAVTAEMVAAQTVDAEQTDAEFLRWLGRRIRVLRVNRGLSQEQLAVTARMSRNFVSSIERGAHGVEVLRLRRLAAAVGVSLVTLIDPGVESGSLALSASAGSRGQVASIGGRPG